MSLSFPRLRRYRLKKERRLVFQNLHLHPSDFIYPLFVTNVEDCVGISSWSSHIYRFDLQGLLAHLEPLVSLGLGSVLLFPVLSQESKDEQGSAAFLDDAPLLKAISHVKKDFPHLNVFCDVALDPYTNHGHDGILDAHGQVQNDLTIQKLADLSLRCAQAGADGVAPSDMMDGRVKLIRGILDEAGFQDVLLVSYAAKFASAFYGPFRSLVNAPAALDKKSYQLHPFSDFESVLEIESDLKEGADALIVKPASHYLDVVREACEKTVRPIGVYQVSGEFAALELGAKAGLWSFESALWESFFSFKRSGCAFMISYGTAFALKNWASQEQFF